MLLVAAAGLDREVLLCRDRERKLQNDLEAATARLFHQEQVNVELRMRQEQLIGRIHQQQVSSSGVKCLSEGYLIYLLLYYYNQYFFTRDQINHERRHKFSQSSAVPLDVL